jgi:hypothetical protein
MGALYEADQIGKRESLADLISNIEADKTPYSSMLPKLSKPGNVKHDWQTKSYRKTGHRGILDGQDATNFTSQNRKLLTAVAQKSWELPAVSDFAEEAVVAGLTGGENAGQVADALVVVKRIIERRCLSNTECALDDGVTMGNETRGVFRWVQNAAQTLYPVDVDFRTPTASILTGALSTITETAFRGMCRSNYKERHGVAKMDGYVGIDLKAKITDWASYSDDVSSKTNTRTFTEVAASKMIVRVIDKLALDTGDIDLHPVSFAYTDPDTGDVTDFTHRSGVFLDMEMMGLAFTRLPRVKELEYQGGGYKSIVDTIFMHLCRNPLGQMAVKSDSD